MIAKEIGQRVAVEFLCDEFGYSSLLVAHVSITREHATCISVNCKLHHLVSLLTCIDIYHI